MDNAASTPASPGRMIAIVAVFAGLGPLAGPALMWAAVCIFGIFSLGPGALLMFPLYMMFWMPMLYILYGPPFLLSGIFYAAAARFTGQQTLAMAIMATVAAFALFFGGLLLVTGAVRPVTVVMGSPMTYELGSTTFNTVIGVVVCWWLVRVRKPKPSKTAATAPTG